MKSVRMWSFGWSLALSAVAACGGSETTTVPDSGAGDGDVDRMGSIDAEPVASCPLAPNLTELALPMSEVKGILKGQSHNASTTCTRQKGTGGPEAFYLLKVTERSIIELRVTSSIDTVVAVRKICDDPLSEVACNDTPASASGLPGGMGGAGGVGGGPVDAAAPPPRKADAAVPDEPPPSGDSRDGFVRTTLEPGSYFVLVDEAAPNGVGGPFTLKVQRFAPPANAVCATPMALRDGVTLPSQELDTALERPKACTGTESRPALFYGVSIPSGQRLTVRAQALTGDAAWVPVLQLLSACGGGAVCLATDKPSMQILPDGQVDRPLRYTNNSGATEDLLISVSSTVAVSGATFRLDVRIGEPASNVSCQSARALSDNQMLTNQDLSEGQPSMQSMCMKPIGASLFYKATLFERQELHVSFMQRPPIFAPIAIVLYDGCGNGQCMFFGDRVDYVNTGPGTKTIILEITSFSPTQPSIFDLMVSMPLPPGGIAVSPTRGLRTSETGATASFDVVLKSPPTATVMIPIESGNTAEGTASPSALVFGPTDWDKPQRVVVTGADDKLKDGLRGYVVQVKPAVSADPRYNSLDGDDVLVVNLDDEPGFTVEAPGALVTSEAGTEARFTVVLNQKPTADVQLGIASSNEAEGTVSPALLTFTSDTWNKPQTVTVKGKDDAARDGVQAYKVVLKVATSSDLSYAGIDPDDLDARNMDNDFDKVALQPVSPDGAFCAQFGGSVRQLAADEAGTLYAIMICQGMGGFAADAGFATADGASSGAGGSGGAVATDGGFPLGGDPVPIILVSSDGAHTFSAPRTIDAFGTFEATIAAGPPGVAYAAAAGRTGIVFTRTETAGASWESPVSLAPSGGGIQIAAAGPWVAVTGFGPMGQTLWWNEDGGRGAFKAVPLLDQVRLVSTYIDSKDGSLWGISAEKGLIVRRSVDGGTTFDQGRPLPFDFFASLPSQFAFGPKTLYGVSDDARFLAIPLADFANPRSVTGLQPFSSPRALVADLVDNATTLEADPNTGVIRARRLVAGGSAFEVAHDIGRSETLPSAAVLSDKAVAVLLTQGGRTFVAVETW